jgi:hypothetical protein
VSGYDWRDGIGERDRRPSRKSSAWTGVEHNDFDNDQFSAFCRELGTEPMIAVFRMPWMQTSRSIWSSPARISKAATALGVSCHT